MSTVFCVGVITIAFMIFITFVVLLTGIVTNGEFDDPDVIILSLFIFISFAIIVGSIIFTKFMYEPEQFGYTRIETETVEVKEHVDSSVVLEEE